jgi:hypothetical protein
MRSIFTSTRYANVTATLALLLALGGTSYAVTQVTGANVKNGSLTGKDIKKESLGSKQIKGLKAGDFSSPLPTGPSGPPGAPGSAKAYGHVLANGTLDAANSSGIRILPDAGFTGAYCIDWTGGTPVNAITNIDVGGADSRKSISSVVFGSAATSAIFCQPGADFVVYTSNSQTFLNQDLPFYVAIIA